MPFASAARPQPELTIPYGSYSRVAECRSKPDPWSSPVAGNARLSARHSGPGLVEVQFRDDPGDGFALGNVKAV